MNRRRFLTLLGLLPAAAVVPFPLLGLLARSPTASFDGKLYRGDDRGRILVSADGRNWRLHIYLGPDYRVANLAIDPGNRLRATIGYTRHAFDLALAPNGRSWVTV